MSNTEPEDGIENVADVTPTDILAKHYILDPSALVYGGIGKIKQWMDNANNGNLQAEIFFYVPLYTLKELDFLKKVFNHLISANARESIKFIDNQISSLDFNQISLESDCESHSDAENHNDINQKNDDDCVTDFESYNLKKQQQRNKTRLATKQKNRTSINFILENEDNVGPDWKITSGYRRSTPLVSQLPAPINGSSKRGQFNHENGRKTIGVFGNNIPGCFNMSASQNMEFTSSNYEYGCSENATLPANESLADTEKAVVPIKLKYLIRSCVQKQYIENKDKRHSEKVQWDVICEDMTTTIWLRSFGLSVKNVNQVQRELIGTTETLDSTAVPVTTSSIGRRVLFDPSTGKFTNKDEIFKKSHETSKSNKTKSKKRARSKNKNKNMDKSIVTDKVDAPAEKHSIKGSAQGESFLQSFPAQSIDISEPRSVSADSFRRPGPGELWVP